MQNIIKIKDIKFKFTQQGCENGVEVRFGQGLVFWSCKRGGDLFDFDVLLKHFIPNIDFEVITYSIARWWEQKLYRELSKCEQQRSATKVFKNFCTYIESKYGKKQSHIVKESRPKLMEQLEKLLSEKMGLMRNSSVVSRMEFCLYMNTAKTSSKRGCASFMERSWLLYVSPSSEMESL